MALIGSLLEGEDGIFGGHLRLAPQWIPIDLVRNQHKADEDDPDFHVCSIQGHEIGSAWLLPRAPEAYVYGYVEIRLTVALVARDIPAGAALVAVLWDLSERKRQMKEYFEPSETQD